MNTYQAAAMYQYCARCQGYNDDQSKGNELVLEKRANSFLKMCIYFDVQGFVTECRLSLFVASKGYSLVVMHGLLIAVASLVVERRL